MGKDQSDTSQLNGGVSLLCFVLAVLAFAKFHYPFMTFVHRITGFVVHYWHPLVLSFEAALAFVAAGAMGVLRNKYIAYRSRKAVTEPSESSVFIGMDMDTGEEIHIKEDFLSTHAQVCAGTGEGKTLSTVQNWAAQGIAKGRGMIIIDGKADKSFRDQIYAHVARAGRQSDFMMFSLSNPYCSSTFNPFCEGSPEQIAERIFSAFDLGDNDYYKSLQFAALRAVIALLMRRGERPMPGVIRELLRDQEKLKGWLTDLQDDSIKADIAAMLEQKPEAFRENYSGLVTALGHFSEGITARLYNTRNPEINLMDVLLRGKICYFQLPTMQFPFLGAATGKLVLQSLQSAVSQIQESGRTPKELFMVYLDDFNDYLYPKFKSLLNKSRSANVGVVFSHQSLGDLDQVGDDFRDVVLNNTKNKVIMRLNDPDTAEYFSKLIGTVTSEKSTFRRSRKFFGSQDTGEESVRETESYPIHPNFFKSVLTRGKAVVIISYPHGRLVLKVNLKAAEELPAITLPIRDLPEIDILKESTYRGKEKAEKKDVPNDPNKGTETAQKTEQKPSTGGKDESI